MDSSIKDEISVRIGCLEAEIEYSREGSELRKGTQFEWSRGLLDGLVMSKQYEIWFLKILLERINSNSENPAKNPNPLPEATPGQ
jgi:hypothetical protein